MKKWIPLLMAAAMPACANSTYAHAEYGHEHEHASHHDDDGDEHEGHHHHEHEAPITAEARAAASHVLVLQTTDGRATEVLGLVDVHQPMGGESGGLEELKARAAMLGADALVGVEFHHDDSGGTHAVTHLSGMAVRFRDLVNGRPYDVLGAIDVTDPMGDEDELYHELRERGGALHADLIINIRFEHGEGGPLHLAGTAIHFR